MTINIFFGKVLQMRKSLTKSVIKLLSSLEVADPATAIHKVWLALFSV